MTKSPWANVPEQPPEQPDFSDKEINAGIHIVQMVVAVLGMSRGKHMTTDELVAQIAETSLIHGRNASVMTRLLTIGHRLEPFQWLVHRIMRDMSMGLLTVRMYKNDHGTQMWVAE